MHRERGRPGESMNTRLFRIALIVVLVLLAVQVLQPYVFRLMFSATSPRPVEPRGELADTEKSTIELFRRVSPSVVQVVGRVSNAGMFSEDSEGVQSGTGFIWDQAGDIVTNNHVVAGVNDVAVRLTSGDVVGADIVGTAPIYDLGVIRLLEWENPRPALALIVKQSSSLCLGARLTRAASTLCHPDRRGQDGTVKHIARAAC